MEHDLLTTAEAASLLRLSRTVIRDLCRAKKIAHHRVGVGRGSIRIERQAIEDYLARTKVEVSNAPTGRALEIAEEEAQRKNGKRRGRPSSSKMQVGLPLLRSLGYSRG